MIGNVSYIIGRKWKWRNRIKENIGEGKTVKLSKKEMLNYAIVNGIIDLSAIQDSIIMNERKKYLEKHIFSTWQGNDDKYYTYLPDDNNKRGKRLLKRTTKDALDDAIIAFYKAEENEPTVEAVFQSWIDEKLEYGEIQKQTYDKYKNNFVRFFQNKNYPISNRKIRYVDEEILEKFIKTVISKLELTQKAYSDMRILINGIFKYAKRHGHTQISITQFMGDLELSRRMFKRVVKRKEDEVFLEDEIPMIIDYLRKENDIRSLGLLLVFQSGLRVGELSALKPADIVKKQLKNSDKVKKYISVTRTEVKYRNENGSWVQDVREYPKTEAGIRNVIVSDHAMETVARIRKINPFGEYLFMEHGQRIRGNAFNKKLNRVCKALHINKRTMHKIRKTYGTTLIDNNVDDALVAEMMGHKDISTTKKYYYYSNKSDSTKVDQMEQALVNY